MIVNRTNRPSTANAPASRLASRSSNAERNSNPAHRDRRLRSRRGRAETAAPASGGCDGRSDSTSGVRDGHRRDLRAGRPGLHAAVAGGRRHQLRAGRVRDAAGVFDAVLHRRRVSAVARVPADVRALHDRSGVWLQARDRRPADQAWRDPARHRDARAVDRGQVDRACRLQRRSASVSEPVPGGPVRARRHQCLLCGRRHAGHRGC